MFGVLGGILVAALILWVIAIPGKMLGGIGQAGKNMEERNHRRRMEQLAAMTDAEKEEMRKQELKAKEDRRKDMEETKQQLKDGWKDDPGPFILLGVVLALVAAGFIAGLMEELTAMFCFFGAAPVATLIGVQIVKSRQKKNSKET